MARLKLTLTAYGAIQRSQGGQPKTTVLIRLERRRTIFILPCPFKHYFLALKAISLGVVLIPFSEF
jgi:hypothetical protein